MMTKLMMVMVVLLMAAGCSNAKVDGTDWYRQGETSPIISSGDPIMYEGVEWHGVGTTAILRPVKKVERVYND